MILDDDDDDDDAASVMLIKRREKNSGEQKAVGGCETVKRRRKKKTTSRLTYNGTCHIPSGSLFILSLECALLLSVFVGFFFHVLLPLVKENNRLLTDF